MRVRVATKSLVKTRHEMEKHCHNIIRLFRNNPVIMNVVRCRSADYCYLASLVGAR